MQETEREELGMMLASLRRHLERRERAGIRFLPVERLETKAQRVRPNRA